MTCAEMARVSCSALNGVKVASAQIKGFGSHSYPYLLPCDKFGGLEAGVEGVEWRGTIVFLTTLQRVNVGQVEIFDSTVGKSMAESAFGGFGRG